MVLGHEDLGVEDPRLFRAGALQHPVDRGRAGRRRPGQPLAEATHLVLDLVGKHRAVRAPRESPSGPPAPGAQATPGDTPIPRSTRDTVTARRSRWRRGPPARSTACSASRPVGPDGNRAAALRREHHHAHDALPVDPYAVLGQLDLGVEAVGQPDDPSGRPRVESVLVDDGGFALDHSPSRLNTRRSDHGHEGKAHGGERRTEPAADRNAGRGEPASAPSPPDQPKPARIPACHQRAWPVRWRSRRPARPRSMARGTQELPMAAPTLIPAPSRSAATTRRSMSE